MILREKIMLVLKQKCSPGETLSTVSHSCVVHYRNSHLQSSIGLISLQVFQWDVFIQTEARRVIQPTNTKSDVGYCLTFMLKRRISTKSHRDKCGRQVTLKKCIVTSVKTVVSLFIICLGFWYIRKRWGGCYS